MQLPRSSTKGCQRGRPNHPRGDRISPAVKRPHPEWVGVQRSLGHRGWSQLVQAKLRIGPVSDAFEREADRVAEHVVRMPDPGAFAPAASAGAAGVQRKCAACREEEQVQRCCSDAGDREPELLQRQPEPEEEEELQTKRIPAAGPLPTRVATGEEDLLRPKLRTAARADRRSSAVTPKIQGEIGALRTQATPLPPAVRAYFEPRLGFDFGAVRFHAGGRAARTAHALNARAFTVGRDVVFGSGQYDPASTDGRRLLAHELAHVVQQGHATRLRAGGGAAGARVSP